jgi:hypothetical protein
MTKYVLDLDAMGTMEMTEVAFIINQMIAEVARHGTFQGSKKINYDNETGQVWRSGEKNKT